MKAFTSSILAIPAILSVASAAPASGVTPRDYSTIDITFTGATPEASYCQTFPIDECWNDITNDPFALSISYVEYNHDLATCYFEGVDSGLATASEVAEHVIDQWHGQLGPPQTLCKVKCVPCA